MRIPLTSALLSCLPGRRQARPSSSIDPDASAALVVGGADANEAYAEAFLKLYQAEYEQVKAELLVSIGTQHRSTQYSLVAAAAMFTGLLSQWDDVNIRVAILSLGPLLMGFLWFIWFGEFQRMTRAAQFLQFREAAASAFFKSQWNEIEQPRAPLIFEAWIRGIPGSKRSKQLRLSYIVNSCAIFGIGGVAIILGWQFGGIDPRVAILRLGCTVVLGGLAALGVFQVLMLLVSDGRNGSDGG